MWALMRYDGDKQKEIDRGEDLAELYRRRDRENRVALVRFGSFARRRFGVVPVAETREAATLAVGAA